MALPRRSGILGKVLLALTARRRQVRVLDLKGKVHWEGDLDESRLGLDVDLRQ